MSDDKHRQRVPLHIDDAAISALVAEYQALRTEIRQRTDIQQCLLQIHTMALMTIS